MNYQSNKISVWFSWFKGVPSNPEDLASTFDGLLDYKGGHFFSVSMKFLIFKFIYDKYNIFKESK